MLSFQIRFRAHPPDGSEEAVSEGNSIDLAGTQIQIVAQDGASDLNCRPTASSINTFESYFRAVSIALGSSSFRDTLLTPNDEPERAGFTKTG